MTRNGLIMMLVGCLAGLGAGLVGAEAPATLRLDYYHSGTAKEEHFSFDRLVVEPLPWPGNPHRPIDETNLGKYRFEVLDPQSGKVLYSRGFASIYGEWETTGEARKRRRTLHESVRFPHPGRPFTVRLAKRDAAQAFQAVWSIDLDPADIFVDTSAPPRLEALPLEHHGPPASKVDLLLLGDGYTAAQCASKFETDARRLLTTFFATSPFKERRQDFNVWGLCPPSEQAGVSRPSGGIHRRNPVGSTYDAFGSERYVLTFENKAFRDIASWAPYDFVEIMVNSETYGGGGIFGLYATVAVDNDWAAYLFIHEFAHHFGALADEYFTSAVAYEAPAELVEPWEPNVTTRTDRQQIKWHQHLTSGVPLPTPWPKEAFEAHAGKIGEERQRIRSEGRPETEMSALFRRQQDFETKLFGESPHAASVGAFEGANYLPAGYYRPQMDCLMFSRNPVPFCAVCSAALTRVIDLYTAGP